MFELDDIAGSFACESTSAVPKKKFDNDVWDFSKDPPLPNRSPPLTQAGCASIYYQLALLHRKLDNHKAVLALSAYFIAELYETARCDDEHGTKLQDVRCSYTERLREVSKDGKKVVRNLAEKVVKRQELSVEDKQKVVGAFLHYENWTLDRLVSMFTACQKLKWYMWDNFSPPTALVITALGTGLSAVGTGLVSLWKTRIARNSHSTSHSTVIWQGFLLPYLRRK